jgi:hypothetical protein
MKNILLLAAFFAGVCFAANEIEYFGDTGQTLYVRLIQKSTQKIWDGDSFETAPTWTETVIALTENANIIGFYSATFPAAIDTAGSFYILLYVQAGASATNTDTRLTAWEMQWSGSAEIALNDIKAKTDNLPASPAAVGSEMTLTAAYDAAKTAAAAGAAMTLTAGTVTGIKTGLATETTISDAVVTVTMDTSAIIAAVGNASETGNLAIKNALDALNDLGSADIEAAAAAALAAYDGPTNAQMEARTLASNDYATAAAVATVDGNIDAIKAAFDEPVFPSGVASNLYEMLYQLWGLEFYQATLTGDTRTTFDAEGNANTTQSVSFDGTTKTVGAAEAAGD